MNPGEYIEKMTNIQQNILDFLNDEDATDIEDKFKNFQNLIIENKIQDNQHELKSLLHIIVQISNDHHRVDNYFNKIDKILELFTDELVKYFSNSELFNIFKSNKRILLFLIESKIIIFDEFIAKRIVECKYLIKKYPEYFQPEIRPFIKEKWFPQNLVSEIQKEVPEDFYERRKIGENDNFICRIIQKDSLDDFIVYINETNYPLEFSIRPSKYETNNFLLKEKNDQTTLIEYAAFFGSIQIFNHLRSKNVALTQSLWKYAIHSNNAEIIQILEENQTEQDELQENELYEIIFKESIKCHNIEIAFYIQNNYLEYSNYELINGLKYYNFIFISNDKITETLFNYLCKYDYYVLVFNLIATKDINMNKITIHNIIFFNSIFNSKIFV